MSSTFVNLTYENTNGIKITIYFTLLEVFLESSHKLFEDIYRKSSKKMGKKESVKIVNMTAILKKPTLYTYKYGKNLNF